MTREAHAFIIESPNSEGGSVQDTDKEQRQRLTRIILAACARVLIAEYLLVFGAWYVMASGLRDRSGTPLGADFLNVYAAWILTDRGQAASAYDWAAHRAVENTVAGYAAPYYAWHYPPMFLGVAALAALLPYLWALAVYLIAGGIGYIAALRRIAPPGRESVWLLLAFPGVYDNISNGQNGFITAALLGAGLADLERRPWLAGLLLGLLSYKPQFFVVVPLMLAIGGYGQALLASVATALIGAALSWAALGTETWQAFIGSAGTTQHFILEQGATGWQKIQSVFSLTRMWGGDVETAYIAQGIAAVAALAVCGWIWRGTASLATKASALCAAILLATPYVMDYDLIILAVPIAFLARQGLETGFRSYEKPVLAVLWLLPLMARAVGSQGILLTPFFIIALMLLCMRRALLLPP